MNLELKNLRSKQAKLVNDARSKMEEVRSGMSDAQVRNIEAAYDKIMAEHDVLEGRAVRLSELKVRESALDELDHPHLSPMFEDRSETGRRPVEETQRRAVFNSFLRHGSRGLPTELQAVAQRMRAEARMFAGQGIATTGGGDAGSDGGYLVPTGFMAELVKSLKAWGPMMDPGITRILNTATGVPLPFPTMDDTANMGEQIGESTQVTLGEAAFGIAQIDAYKYTSKLFLVSSELLQDAAFDVEAIVRDAMAERVGRVANRDLTIGDGNAKPHGIVPAATAGATSAAPTDITFDDLIELEHSVDPAYRSDPSCRWMFNDATLKLLRKVKDGNQNYVWQPANVATGAPAQILDHPYSINQAMAAPTAGNKSVVFGAFNKYLVRLVRQLAVRRLVERYADFDQIGFIGFTRFDGELLDPAAVKVLTQHA